MKKFVGYLLVATILLLSASLFSRDVKDRDDNRGDQVKQKTHYMVKTQKNGKIVVVTKQSKRPLTKRDQRKAAQIRRARAKAIPQNAFRKVKARSAKRQLHRKARAR